MKKIQFLSSTKKSFKESVQYTVVNHTARLKLRLTLNEYCLLDLIHNLSKDPDYSYWCYAAKDTIADMLGVSKKTVHELIKKMAKKKLLIKNPVTKHLKVNLDWNDRTNIKNSNETSQRMKKGNLDSEEGSLPTSEESSHNNDKSNKDNTYEENSKNSLSPLTKEDVIRLALEHRIDLPDVRRMEKQVLNPENITKYKYKTTYNTVTKWLDRAIRNGQQQQLDEAGMMVLKGINGN